MTPEEDYSFQCPHCGETIAIRLEASGGSQQSFSYDCEVCCRPIFISARFKGHELTAFEAVSES